MRHGAGLRENDAAGDFAADSPLTAKSVEILEKAVQSVEKKLVQDATAQQLRKLVADWHRRARESEEQGFKLRYMSSDKDYPALLCNFGERRDGWPTMNSMRSVDRQVRVIAIGESG
jgi:hypothetical protein